MKTEVNFKPKVSVIVPVYNVEKYLPKCLDSILSQTFMEFELLIINDGSTDNSLETCMEYEKRDSRIRLFSHDNIGLSRTRQVGLMNACGEYSIHIDSDDWIDSTMLEDMYKEAKLYDADVVIVDYYTNLAGKDIRINRGIPSMEIKEDLSSFAYIEGMIKTYTGMSIINKLYKHSLFTELKVGFSTKIRIGEDSTFNMELFLSKELKMRYIPHAYYHHVIVSTSISNTFDKEHVICVDKVINILEENLIKFHLPHLLPYIDKIRYRTRFIALTKDDFKWSEYKNIYPDVLSRIKEHRVVKMPIKWTLMLWLSQYRVGYITCKIFLDTIKKIK